MCKNLSNSVRRAWIPALLAGVCALTVPAQAQTYCTPTVTGTNFYISSIQFNYNGAGTVWNTGNNGYSANTASSSKTVPRYYSHSCSFWYAITSSASTATQLYLQCFADWNHDGDFDDAYETNYLGYITAQPNTTTSTGISFPPSLDAVPGPTRMRIIISAGNTITNACAPVTGEVEDYTITVSNSTAPVLSTSAVAFLNPQLASQTASEGFTINQLVTSSMPTAALVTDADDSTAYYVPRGIALTGASGTNGTWEYKIGAAGTWTSIGAVSPSNALLLLGDGSDTRYQPGTRLRFVPTGTGTPGLSFRAWDGTAGVNGTYASTAVNGGNTAFSTNTASASLSVNSGSPARRFYLASASADNILSSSFEPSANQGYTPSAIVSANPNLTNVTDMDFDAANRRLIWTESAASDKIVSSGLDGSNVTVLYAFPNTASIPNGVAVGGGKIYFTDNATSYKGIYRMDMNGANLQQISGGAGQLATPNQVRDIEYYNGKLYALTRTTSSSTYSVYQLDTNGANPVEVASSANLMQYLAVGSGNVFWTEVVSSVGSLYAKPLAGGSVSTLASATNRFYRDIFVDSAVGRAYYLDYSTVANMPADRALMSAPFGATTGSVVKVLTLPETYLAIASDVAPAPSALGLSMLDFSGRTLAAANQLEWRVSQAGAGEQFTLERSAGGTGFEPIAVIAGGTERYTYEDRNAPSGLSVYRLSIRDAAGTLTYSNAVSLLRSGAPGSGIRVYPNPAQHELYVSGAVPQLLELYNALGQKVASAAGVARLSLNGLPAGTYNLRIRLESHAAVINQRVVKQ